MSATSTNATSTTQLELSYKTMVRIISDTDCAILTIGHATQQPPCRAGGADTKNDNNRNVASSSFNASIISTETRCDDEGNMIE